MRNLRLIRSRPSRAASLVGLIVGLILLAMGVAVVVPTFGVFGWFWMLCAGLATVTNAINVFTPRGLADRVIEVEGPAPLPPGADFDARLRRLAKLKDDGLITTEEFGRKRAEILQERW